MMTTSAALHGHVGAGGTHGNSRYRPWPGPGASLMPSPAMAVMPCFCLQRGLMAASLCFGQQAGLHLGNAGLLRGGRGRSAAWSPVSITGTMPRALRSATASHGLGGLQRVGHGEQGAHRHRCRKPAGSPLRPCASSRVRQLGLDRVGPTGCAHVHGAACDCPGATAAAGNFSPCTPRPARAVKSSTSGSACLLGSPSPATMALGDRVVRAARQRALPRVRPWPRSCQSPNWPFAAPSSRPASACRR